MAAECEINDCGVLAIGRCVACGRAMCTSHRGRGSYGQPVVDQCSECQSAERMARGSALTGRAERVSRAMEQIKAVARHLAANGVPPDTRVCEGKRLRRGILGGEKWVRDPASDLYGWFIGEYDWTGTYQSGSTTARTFVGQDGSLMMDGGGIYQVYNTLPGCIPVADWDRGPPLFERPRPEFWEEILSKMIDLARKHGVEVG